jgi:hypothetical protein
VPWEAELEPVLYLATSLDAKREFPFKPSRFESAYALIDLVAAQWWHRHERKNDFGYLVDVRRLGRV